MNAEYVLCFHWAYDKPGWVLCTDAGSGMRPWIASPNADPAAQVEALVWAGDQLRALCGAVPVWTRIDGPVGGWAAHWPSYAPDDDRCPECAENLSGQVRWLRADGDGANTWQCCTMWHTAPRV
ncbi:hypothetical protein AB0M43_00460 [Longispora sp. NPDC051575]|uniref:hypothetical protein n=1 Tax=Longispora sp. NPDC051575 TaxID=3154943 RepID=UPI0034386DC9